MVVGGKRVGGLVDDVVVDGGGGSGLEAVVVVGEWRTVGEILLMTLSAWIGFSIR